MGDGSSEALRVVSVNISERKGTSKHPVPEILIDEHGVRGDAHAGSGLRQVSVLARESIERFSAEAGRQFRAGMVSFPSYHR